MNTKNKLLIYQLILIGIILIFANCKKNETAVVTDFDGNVYDTITIGTQVWMVENLRTIHYNNGTYIPNVTDSTWQKLSTGAYCWYNNNVIFKDTYGALYNWYAVNTGKLCPTGWHVPTDDEWTTLTTYLGGESVAGSKLKETGTTHWENSNSDATNETGFTALPGGYRNGNGVFVLVGSNGGWWTSTDVSTSDAWYRFMLCYFNTVGRSYYYKQDGFFVRCLKDQ